MKNFNLFFLVMKMNNNNTYYERNKERLHEKSRNHYNQERGKKKQKSIMKITKRGWKNMPEINTENCLMRKRI